MIEPIAFGIASGGRLLASYTCEDEQSAREMADLFAASGVSVTVLPLYRQPQPTLTDAERGALKTVLRRLREDYFAGRFSDSVEIAAVIDGLLERLK